MPLQWPPETVLPDKEAARWFQPWSNIVLDFHGDPLKAKLAVFSDGNHHMALLPALKAFHAAHPEVGDIFYASTPTAPILTLLKTGALQLGNLILSIRPHLFISPSHVLDRLQEEGYVSSHRMLARNQGSVLLIPQGNPKAICGVEDLMRDDVRLFISNPDTESVSYQGYRQTLEGMAKRRGMDVAVFSASVFGPTAVWGQRIHHREAPESVAAGLADAAIVFYHLALRYTRIFPDLFDHIPLGGTKSDPVPPPENHIAAIHMGLVGDGGIWGTEVLDFLKGRTVADIYAFHGLRHTLDQG